MKKLFLYLWAVLFAVCVNAVVIVRVFAYMTTASSLALAGGVFVLTTLFALDLVLFFKFVQRMVSLICEHLEGKDLTSK